MNDPNSEFALDANLVLSGPAVKTDNPISTGHLKRLIKKAQSKHYLLGSYADAPKPICIINTCSKSHYNDLKSNPTLGLMWTWPSEFGPLTTLSVTSSKSIKNKDKHPPYGRIFIPTRSSFIRSLHQCGTVYFAFINNKSHSPFFKIDFSDLADYDQRFDEFQSIYETDDLVRNSPFHDDKLAFYWMLDHPSMQWSDYNSKTDMLKSGYAQWLGGLLSRNNSIAKTHQAKIQNIDSSVFENLYFPPITSFYKKLFQSIESRSVNCLTFANDLADLFYRDSEDIRDKTIRTIFRSLHNIADTSLGIIVRDILVICHMLPDITKYGTRQAFFSVPPKILAKLNFVEIDTEQLSEEECKNFWRWRIEEFMPLDLGLVLTGRDVPVPPSRKQELLEAIDLKEIEDGKRVFNEVLYEAEQNRKWSVPWGATVEINLPGFKYAQIYQIWDEFVCLFRDEDNRYFPFYLNLQSKNCSSTLTELGAFCHYEKSGSLDDLFCDEDYKYGERKHFAVGLLLACVIRDFMVVEERQKVFSSQKKKIGNRQHDQNKPIIVYIPRIKYSKAPRLNKYNTVFEPVPRAEHAVSSHLRKVETASKKQQVLAMRFGFRIPFGYTFVRPHKRGGKVSEDRKRIYRSRSVLNLLFDVESYTQAKPEVATAWFKFERDVVDAFTSRGFSVEHIAASRNGDGGVDVFAFDENKNEVWAVQCKYFRVYPSFSKGLVPEITNFSQLRLTCNAMDFRVSFMECVNKNDYRDNRSCLRTKGDAPMMF